MRPAEPSRRDFLAATAAAAASTASAVPALVPRATAKQVIFLFMSGGPGQLDTFDPKDAPDTSLTKAIATSVPGVRVSELFPQFAKLVHLAGIVRSFQTPVPDHALGRYYTHTGYRATTGVVHPGIGSVVAKERGDPDAELPAFVQVGPCFGGVTGDEGVSRYTSYGPGFLGPRYQPLAVKDPAKGVDDLRALVGDREFNDRLELRAALGGEFAQERRSAVVADQEETARRAVRLMRSKRLAAFDLAREPLKVREGYGKSPFGAGCLLARRLVEAGVPFVEVGMTGWDTHGEHLARHKVLCGATDPALAALVTDLKDRGLLDTTLIVWVGEMGRTLPGKGARSGSNHHGKAGVALLLGGGVKGGRVVGKTDAKGMDVTERPLTVQDLHATIYRALGIDHTKTNTATDGRPFRLADGEHVKPLTELFA